MPYLGRSFHNNHFSTIPAVERFNGNGSTTAFTLSRAPGNENEILVSVDGVIQDTTAYAVASTTLTFTTAPATGTANIFVNFLTDHIDTITHPSNISLRATSGTFTSSVSALGTLTIGVDDTGHDVKFFGATSGAYMLWDESVDDLILAGAARIVVPDGQLVLNATAVTSTAAELNIMDGGTSAVSTTVVDADRVVLNDAGTMKQVAVTDLAAYFDDELTQQPNLVQVGALNSGTITSGFGTIDTGSSTITTTGAITGGSVVVDEMTLNADTITATDDFIIDAVGDITLDAAGDDILLKSGGTHEGNINLASSNLTFKSIVSDKDMLFQGNDGGSAITALTIDMSEAGAATFNAGVVATTADFSSVATATTFEPDGDTAAGDNAAIGYTSAEGLILTGQGSTNDVTIKNDADADVLEIPTGTVNVTVAGDFTAAGTLNVTGDTASGDDAAIGYTNVEGLILTGQGSTNDVTIKNDADADVLEIATGTTNVTVVGDISAGATLNAAGDTAAGDNAAIGYTSAEGLILTGQGSTNDITIKNDADADVITIATGTTVVGIPGSLDIEGAIDVNGTANLDIVDIDGAVDMASTLTVGDIVGIRTAAASSVALTVKSTGNTDSALVVQQTGNTDGWGLTPDNTNGNLDFVRIGGGAGTYFRLAIDGSLSTPTAGTSNVRFGVNAGNSIASGGNYNTVVGDEAGTAITTGDENTAVGYSALVTMNTGQYNTAIGKGALQSDEKGNQSVAVGANALQTQDFSTATNALNTAVGYYAGQAMTTGTHNTLIGALAGDALTTSVRNTAVGTEALGSATTGDNNTAIGYKALFTNVDGDRNVAVGVGSLQTFEPSAGDTYNVAVGFDAGNKVTTGTGNTLIGGLTGDALTAGNDNVAIGLNALSADTLGSGSVAIGNVALQDQNFTTATNAYNTAIGRSAGRDVTTGVYNTLIGGLAGDALTDAHYNVAIGKGTLTTDTLGSKSIAIGVDALATQNFTTATDANNIAVGFSAGNVLTTGTNNILIGSLTGDALTDADVNVAVGHRALSQDTLGSRSVAIGPFALYSQNFTTATNSYNTAVGVDAGLLVTTGIENTLIGGLAGDALTDADYNVAIGINALGYDQMGSRSVAIGRSALATQRFTTATESHNVAIGYNAGQASTTGTDNTLVGYNAGGAVTTGHRNVLLGSLAGDSLADADDNVAIGMYALTADTLGSRSVAIGKEALAAQNFTTATFSNNTAVGAFAGNAVSTGVQNVLIGALAGDSLTTSSSNTAVGFEALSTATVYSENTALGHRALKVNSDGHSNTAVGHDAMIATTTGAQNVAVGHDALATNIDGNANVAVGYEALTLMEPAGGASYNVGLGHQAGALITTGDKNTCVGGLAGYLDANNRITTGDNNTMIGYGTHPSAAGGADQICLGRGVLGYANSSFVFGKDTGSDRVWNTFSSNATFTRVSDERYKKDIQTNTDCGLDFINDLRTVTFKFKAKSEIPNTLPDYNATETEAEHTDKLYGLIAQEVKAALATHNITDFGGHSEEEDSGIQGVAQSMFIYPLIKATQELSAKIDALQTENTALKARVITLEE